jgi:hypothetical protein
LTTEVREISLRREKWFWIRIQKGCVKDWMEKCDDFRLDEEDPWYKAWIKTTA